MPVYTFTDTSIGDYNEEIAVPHYKGSCFRNLYSAIGLNHSYRNDTVCHYRSLELAD